MFTWQRCTSSILYWNYCKVTSRPYTTFKQSDLQCKQLLIQRSLQTKFLLSNKFSRYLRSWCCLCALNRTYNTHLVGFHMRAIRQEWKLGLKNEVLCISRNPGQCMLKVSSNTLQQVEKSKYIVMIFMSDGKQNKETDTRIGEANAVLRELYSCALTKPELQTPQSCYFWNRSMFRSSPMDMTQ